jgi:hypothetical protein
MLQARSKNHYRVTLEATDTFVVYMPQAKSRVAFMETIVWLVTAF